MGVGFSAASAGAITMATDASPKQSVGSILGGLNSMQPIGTLFFLQAGGYLLDTVGYWTPFALKGIVNLILALWLIVVRKRIKAETEATASLESLPFTMEWESGAKTMLKKVPAAFREAAVSGTEAYATEHSYEKVTTEVMTKYRKELGM
jgi:MFS family permease